MGLAGSASPGGEIQPARRILPMQFTKHWGWIRITSYNVCYTKLLRFRPTVWRLAERLGLTGEVHNDGQGVSILLYPAAAAEGFVAALTQALPPLAHIESVTSQLEVGGEAPTAFTIAPSGAGRVATQIAPDAALCPACRAEIRDPALA